MNLYESQLIIDNYRGKIYEQIIADCKLLNEFLDYKVYEMMTLEEMYLCIDQLLAEVLAYELF